MTTTDSHHADPIAPTRLARQCEINGVALHRVWVGTSPISRRGGGLITHAVARDITGDALWGITMAWRVGMLLPHGAVGPRSAAALAVCVAVEVSQLLHTPLLDAIRQTTLGMLVLGSGFDARDLLAYTVGVGADDLLEHGTTRRSR